MFPLNIKLKQLRDRLVLGNIEDAQPPRIFAVSSHANTCEVLEYPSDEEGLQSVANLIRAENVEAIIIGHRLQVDMESVVTLRAGDNTYCDRMPLR
jgi:hypothetical protein